jgi:hypothetical protein
MVGLSAWLGLDLAEQLLLRHQAQQLVAPMVHENATLRARLGGDISGYGPWYNDSATLTHRGRIVHVNFTVVGPKAKCDVAVGLTRAHEAGTGTVGALWYAVRHGEYKIMYADAAVIIGGSAPRRLSLLDAEGKGGEGLLGAFPVMDVQGGMAMVNRPSTPASPSTTTTSSTPTTPAPVVPSSPPASPSPSSPAPIPTSTPS